MTAHYRQGGIDVDTETMRSSVPGLYVAGGLGGHSNGLIGLATYDGKVVAEGVGGGPAPPRPPGDARADVQREERRLDALLQTRRDGVPVSQAKNAIRAMMWDKVGVEKDEASLTSALQDIADIRLDLLPRMSVARHRARGQLRMARCHRRHQHGRRLRADHPCRRWSARKAAGRSCGAISRLQDNVRWLSANVMVRTDNGIRFEKRPYEMPFFKPDFAIKDNLEVAW